MPQPVEYACRALLFVKLGCSDRAQKVADAFRRRQALPAAAFRRLSRSLEGGCVHVAFGSAQHLIQADEELSRCGVELIFLKAPAAATPEDQLLVQFQGMIAEYERAQIAERCGRGKKHMAQRGGVNVLSGAPFGYRYVKKSDTSAAFLRGDRGRGQGGAHSV